MFAFVVPPLGGYDETQHFSRAWQVSDGGIFSRVRTIEGEERSGGDLTRAMFDDMTEIQRRGVFNGGNAGDVWKLLDDAEPVGPTVFVTFNGAAPYSPVPYLPAAIAIRAGRLVGLSTLAMVQLARLAQVLVFALLIAFAVRRIPRRQVVLAICGIAPVALVQAGTVNADAISIAMTLLVVAEAFRLLALDTVEIRPSHLVEAGAAVVVLALCKQPYLVVAAFFLLPIWKHRGRAALILLGSLGVAGIATTLWSRWAQDHYVPPNSTIFAGDKKNSFAFVDVDPSQQFTFVREHPFSFLAAVGRTIGHTPGTLVRDMLTQTATWHGGVVLVTLAVLVLIAAVLVDGEPVPGGPFAHVLALAVAIALTLALFLVGYAGWNAVGAKRIDAFQGRYLMPVVAVLAIAAIPRIETTLAKPRFVPFVFGGSTLVSVSLAIGIGRHFY
jgi:uncharacterized membrane protein